MGSRRGYRHRISIQSPPTTEDTFGQQSGAWVDVLTRIPARIVDESERQYFSVLQVKSDKAMSIAIQHSRIEIKASYRIVFHDGMLGTDRVLDITAVLEGDHSARELSILCTEHN